MAEDNTGKERENGYGKPPTEHQFKNGNTASNGVRNGKGPGIVKELKKLMREVVKGDPEGRTGRRFFSQALFKAACKGNGTAIREILDRLEGKVPQPVVLGGPEGGPVVIQYTAATKELDDNDNQAPPTEAA